MSKTITDYVQLQPGDKEGYSITLPKRPQTNEIKIVFADGTFATFNNAGSLQEFLDKVARYHELEKDLEIARKALTDIFFICEQDASKDANARISEIYAIAKNVLEYKE